MDDFDQFKKQLKDHHKAVLRFLKQTESLASTADDKKLLKFIRKEKKQVTESLSELNDRSKDLQPIFKKALQNRTVALKKQIEALTKSKDTLISNNLLLEYKKKDLLLLTNKLEEANEEISIKNTELVQQQQKISEQTQRLNTIHQQILEKNMELEQQKESLLDQSDYLHEANQTITMMHEEVQNQKDEILRKNEELLNLNNEKNNLIGIVAHDLKSPLNQMKGLLSVIKMSAADMGEETLSCITMMENSAERLTELIAKILDVEAIESQNLNLIKERINLSEMLAGITGRFDPSASQKSIKIHRQIDDGVFVVADKIYTTQIFENLISNAVKFSPPGKNIFIRLSVKGAQAVGEVKDEGPGITEADKKKLFGKYQKLTARPTGNETSTGLGLSIVKKFIEAMNGKIWCESTPGDGASFFIAIRLNDDHGMKT